MIRLFCSDFDGTLSPNTTISQENIRAIRRLQDAGIVFALVSGRPQANARKILARAGLTVPMITSNGSVVTLGDGRDVLVKGIATAAMEDILEEAHKRRSFYIAYEKDRCFLPPWVPLLGMGSLARLVQRKTGILPLRVKREELSDWTVTKFNYYPLGKPTEADWHRWEQDERVYVTTSSRHKLELSAAGVSKGNAIRLLAKELGIRSDQIAAIGDYLNDCDMLKAASLRFAVANAREELKAIADHVVSSAKENGVAEAISQVLAD